MPAPVIRVRTFLLVATSLLWCNDDGAGCGGGSSCSTSGLKGLISCLKP